MFTLYLVVTEEKCLNSVFRLTLILCDTSMDHHQTDFSTLQSGLSVMLRSEKEGEGEGGGGLEGTWLTFLLIKMSHLDFINLFNPKSD